MAPENQAGPVMTNAKSISVLTTRLALSFAASLSTAAPAAAEWTYKALDMPATFTSEVGARLWVAGGKTGKNLFDPAGTTLLSRLNYGDLTVFTGEAFTRFDFNTGWFVKGYFGAGGLWDGKLKDEDFGLPAPFNPYSATLSSIKGSYLAYGSIDGGFKVLRGPDFHVGAFVGYHFMRQTVSAYGCGQIADNPLICGTLPVPDSINVITQTNYWNSLRVGLDAAADFGRWRLSADAAWLPYVRLNGSDAHWLRIGNGVGDFTGPVPEDGNGWGYQLEATVSYRLNDWVSVGAGARYWHMEAKGNTHFEGHVVGMAASPQPVNWKTDSLGAFVQTTLKLGPYPLYSRN